MRQSLLDVGLGLQAHFHQALDVLLGLRAVSRVKKRAPFGAEVGFGANPRFRGLLESEIPAFEVERLPYCADGLEERTVDLGIGNR
jgi:hypothetical protein